LSREVVITALGTAGAWGGGRCCLERALAAGTPPAPAEVDRGGGFHRTHGARRALLTPLAALAPWLPAAEARRMSLPSRLAVAAARMAVADSGLAAEQLAGPGTAVVVATAFGPSSFSECLLRQVLLEGPEAASPYFFTESVTNAPAAQIAIACRARGANLTLCQREAGALLAAARGAAEVASGRAERALVGAVDEISPLLHALLDRFGTLARRLGASGRGEGCGDGCGNGDSGDGCGGGDSGVSCGEGCDGGEVGRPFDRRRAGVVAADGATVLLLETAEAAARRGRRPLARVRGWGSAFDPSAPPAGWGSGGEVLGRALRRALARCGAAPGAAAGDGGVVIDRIVSGAAGSRGGDRLEARALRAAWRGGRDGGDDGDGELPPVLAPKAVTGEYGGGFLAAAVLAAAGAPCGPTPGFREVDPELGVTPHDGRPLPPPRAVLASSVAAGGAASWLVLER
jgi:3-oxoacyl-(acyl-carrier-protein) synthase